MNLWLWQYEVIVLLTSQFLKIRCGVVKPIAVSAQITGNECEIGYDILLSAQCNTWLG